MLNCVIVCIDLLHIEYGMTRGAVHCPSLFIVDVNHVYNVSKLLMCIPPAPISFVLPFMICIVKILLN